MIPGTETILCLGLFLLGSVGLFAMFWLTDRNAMQESLYPEHDEHPKPVSKTQEKKA